MAGADTARTVIGIIGNVISFALFASPCPTFWRILGKKSTDEFKPDPYLATFLNCSFWVFYGLPIVHPNSTLVVTINGVGVLIMIFYITIFLIYGNNRQRLRIFIVLSTGLVFLAGIVVLTLLEFHTHTTRSNFIGILCTILVVLMYLSPLTVMKKVIQTKSVEYMPFFLSLTNLLNAVVWLIYALIQFDLYITVGNALGAISGTFQLILYAVYCKSTPKPDAVDKLPKIQLAEANATRPDQAV